MGLMPEALLFAGEASENADKVAAALALAWRMLMERGLVKRTKLEATEPEFAYRTRCQVGKGQVVQTEHLPACTYAWGCMPGRTLARAVFDGSAPATCSTGSMAPKSCGLVFASAHLLCAQL